VDPQLSVAVGAIQLTTALHVVISEGQPANTGYSESVTTTSNEQLDTLLDASVAVTVTVVVPTGNKTPDGTE
jgi:hypothetical protein